MSRVALIQVAPFDPATGQTVPLRLAAGGSRWYTQLGFSDWRAGGIGLPRFAAAIGYDENGWTGAATPTTGAVTFRSGDQAFTEILSRLFWNGAAITINVGDDADSAETYPLALKGRVAKGAMAEALLTLTIGDLAVDLNQPLLVARFAGTGGLEGPIDIATRIKRRTLGYGFDVEGRILDKANSVYEFGDPAFAAQSFLRLKDRGREGPMTVLGWQGSAAATFAALQAASAPQGGGVVAPSIQCAKWWTTPAGPLTADMIGETGGVAPTAPALVAQAVGSRTTIAVDQVDAFAALRPALVGVHVDADNETIAQVLDRLTFGVSLLWLLTPAGSIRFRQWRRTKQGAAVAWSPSAVSQAWGSSAASSPWSAISPSLTLTARSISRVEALVPVKARRLGYQRNNRIHTDAEVSAAIQATDVNYPDGTPVSAVQPAEGGADVTANSQIVVDVTRTVNLAADYQGTVNASMFPIVVGVAVTKGGVSIRDAATTSYLIQTANVTATINNTAGSANKGAISITALAANAGYIDLTVTVGAVTQPTIRIAVVKNLAAVPSAGGGGAKLATDNSFPAISAMDYAALSDVLNVTLAAGERLVGTAPLDYYVQGSTAAQRTASAKWQYGSSASGPWTDFAAEVTGSAASSGYQTGQPNRYEPDVGYVDPQPGHGDFNQAVTGLAAGAYFVRLAARLNAAGRNVTFEGTATIEAKT